MPYTYARLLYDDVLQESVPLRAPPLDSYGFTGNRRNIVADSIDGVYDGGIKFAFPKISRADVFDCVALGSSVKSDVFIKHSSARIILLHVKKRVRQSNSDTFHGFLPRARGAAVYTCIYLADMKIRTFADYLLSNEPRLASSFSRSS